MGPPPSPCKLRFSQYLVIRLFSLRILAQPSLIHNIFSFFNNIYRVGGSGQRLQIGVYLVRMFLQPLNALPTSLLIKKKKKNTHTLLHISISFHFCFRCIPHSSLYPVKCNLNKKCIIIGIYYSCFFLSLVLFEIFCFFIHRFQYLI